MALIEIDSLPNLKLGGSFHGELLNNQRVTVQPAKRIKTHTFLVLRYVGQSGRQKPWSIRMGNILALLLWMTSATPKKQKGIALL